MLPSDDSHAADIQQSCVEVLHKHAKTFRIASYFLPRAVRADAAIAYAFCRFVDDAVDEAKSKTCATRDLEQIEEMVCGRVAPSRLVQAYLDMCQRRQIALTPTLDLIAGARSDVDSVRLLNDDDLYLYCYRVAGTVGLIMCGVLGVTDPLALRRAIDLGIGMQITNICRDVLEDAQMDRVYLPQERLMRSGTDQATLLRSFDQPDAALSVGIGKTVSTLLGQADLFYESGEEGMRFIQGRGRFAIRVASALYRQIGVRLIRLHRGNALTGRVVVPGWQKLLVVSAVVYRLLRRNTVQKPLLVG